MTSSLCWGSTDWRNTDNPRTRRPKPSYNVRKLPGGAVCETFNWVGLNLRRTLTTRTKVNTSISIQHPQQATGTGARKLPDLRSLCFCVSVGLGKDMASALYGDSAARLPI